MAKIVSQRTIVELMRALRAQVLNYGEELYAIDFRDWFIRQANDHIYRWNWTKILVDMRNGEFFQDHYRYSAGGSITGSSLSESSAKQLGESLIQKLAAFATTFENSDNLIRSLELDGFDVDKKNLKLVPLEGMVSAQAEEDRLTRLIKSSGIRDSNVILTHVQDAFSLYAEGKYHPSLGESRNILQALIDAIGTDTAALGKPTAKLPGGTTNRIGYLKDVSFFTADEQAAFNSAWGTLSAGSHPGVPEREQARIGLILALEFGLLLVIKFVDWKANGYLKFS